MAIALVPAVPSIIDDAVPTGEPAALVDAEAELRPSPPEALLRSAADAVVDVARPAAPSRAPNPDSRSGAAARASGHGAGAPTSVTDRADESTLRAQPYDAASGYVLQRIATGRMRESREQVRATPHAERTPWLASRDGDGHQRRAADDPVRAIASDEPASDEADRSARARVLRSAAGHARPDVQEHPAATDAAHPSEAVADRVDEALVSDEEQPAPIELTRPTSPGRAESGHGDGALGFAPVASGAAPVPTGAPGLPDARALALATFQRAYDRYLVKVRERVDPLWEFPRELAVRMEQGDVLVGFTIRSDGTVKDLRVLKGSGFEKFDKNVVAAIRKAAPFEPLPATLGSELRVTAPFEGSNPAIR